MRETGSHFGLGWSVKLQERMGWKGDGCMRDFRGGADSVSQRQENRCAVPLWFNNNSSNSRTAAGKVAVRGNREVTGTDF